MICKISHIMDKSRRDNTLLTAGFNLREKSNAPQVPQGRHLGVNNVPSLRDLVMKLVRYRFSCMKICKFSCKLQMKFANRNEKKLEKI